MLEKKYVREDNVQRCLLLYLSKVRELLVTSNYSHKLKFKYNLIHLLDPLYIYTIYFYVVYIIIFKLKVVIYI
jgi:hypothetical protein